MTMERVHVNYPGGGACFCCGARDLGVWYERLGGNRSTTECSDPDSRLVWVHDSRSFLVIREKPLPEQTLQEMRRDGIGFVELTTGIWTYEVYDAIAQHQAVARRGRRDLGYAVCFMVMVGVCALGLLIGIVLAGA